MVEADEDFVRQLRGYRLTTINLVYYMPDYRDLVQEFVWQYYDIPPRFYRTHRFLNHWKDNVEAVIASVNVCYSDPLGGRGFRNVKLL